MSIAPNRRMNTMTAMLHGASASAMKTKTPWWDWMIWVLESQMPERALEGGNMLTTEGIEYDMEVLGQMDEKQLLLQQIYRQDLLIPKRQTRLNAKVYAQDIYNAIEQLVEGLPEILKPYKDQVREQLAAFQEVIA